MSLLCMGIVGNCHGTNEGKGERTMGAWIHVWMVCMDGMYVTTV